MNISFESWHEPSFYIKDQLPKIEFKIRDNFFIFFSSQLAKMVFDLKTSFFKYCFEFLFIFNLLNKIRNKFGSDQFFKNVKLNMFSSDFIPFFRDFRGFLF